MRRPPTDSDRQAADSASPSSPCASEPPSSDVDDGAEPLRGPLKPARRRWARALLLLGVLAALLPMTRAVPHSRPIEVRLSDPAAITRLELLWIDPEDGTALGHGVWTFSPGTAPPSLRTRISAPAGTFRVQVQVSRGDARQEDQRWVEFGWRDAETRLIIR